MTTLSTTPPELILAIGAYLDPVDLNALIRSGSLFHVLLTDRLYDLGAVRATKNTTPLIHSVQAGNLTAVTKLMDRGADPTLLVDGTTALHQAAIQGNQAILQQLLRPGVTVSIPDHNNVSPAVRAVSYHQTPSVLLLIEAGISTDPDIWLAPLWEAICLYKEEMCRVIFEAAASHGPVSAPCDAVRKTMRSATNMGRVGILRLLYQYWEDAIGEFVDQPELLYTAVESRHRAAVKFFLERGVDTEGRGLRGATSLHHVVRGVADMELLEVLVDGGADIEARNDGGLTPLHAAAHWGGRDAVQFLLDRGADRHACDVRGWNALHHAAITGDQNEVVSVLCEAGVQLEGRSDAGLTPLLLAVSCNSTQKLAALAHEGADLSARDDTGMGALHYCARHRGRKGSLQLLLSTGADLSPVDGQGRTALQVAVREGELFTVKALLDEYQKKNLDGLLKGPFGRTLLCDAVKGIEWEAFKLLLDYGVDVAVDHGRGELLRCLVLHGDEHLVKLLFGADVDPCLLDHLGRIPIDWAVMSESVSEWILEHCCEPGLADGQKQNRILEESVVTTAKRLVTGEESSIPGDDTTITDLYIRIGRCLLFLGNEDTARVAYGQLSESLPDVGLGWWGVRCKTCDRPISFLEGRYICRTCWDVNLCAKCMTGYVDKSKSLEGCEGHEFRTITGRGESKVIAMSDGSDEARARDEWLQSLLTFYGQDTSD